MAALPAQATARARALSWATAVGSVAVAAIAVYLAVPGLVGEAVLGSAMLGMLVAWGALAWSVAKRRVGLERKAWTWFAAASLGTLAGIAAWLGIAAAIGALPASLSQTYLPSAGGEAASTSIFTLAIYATIFVGVLQLARLAGGRHRTMALVLDAAIGAGSVFFIVWSAAYRDIYGASGLEPATRLLVVAYPVLDSALLALAAMAFATPCPGRPRAYTLLLAGFACMMLGDTAGAYFTLQQPGLGVTITVVAQTAALAILVVATLVVRQGRMWEEPDRRPTPLWVHLLPVWPFCFAMLAAVEAQREHGQLSAVQFWTAMVVLALLLVRLVGALRENQRLNTSLTESAAFKTQVLRFVSHEIATPLSPMLIELPVLRQNQDAGRRDRSWQVIQRSIERLEVLARDVRDMALAQTGRIARAGPATDLSVQVQAACRSAESLAAQRGIQVSCRVEPDLRAHLDTGRFAQVLDNLLGNAVKFTPDGGSIEVHAVREGTQAVVRVKDSGAGLSVEQLHGLFHPFARLHPGVPGLGLGLYLCRSIIEALGGTIEASSPGPGRGSTFAVKLPAAK